MNAPEFNEEREILTAEGGTVALLNRAEIDTQIATAHKYPRSITQFRRDVMDMVTISEQVAQECIYAIPRDGKMIEGPSARFAEVVASAWGNARAGARVVNDQGDFVTAQGVYHDLQKNVAITYEVQRRITNSKGQRFKPDMIGVTANAACSIALRNAILKGVPKAFWSDMYEGARKTAMGDVKTLPTRRAEAFKALQNYGISKEQVLAKLGLSGEADIGQEQLLTLRGLLTAIKDGDTTPEQAFSDDAASAKVVTMPPRKTDAQATQSDDDAGKALGTEDTPANKPAAAEANAQREPDTGELADAAERQHIATRAKRNGKNIFEMLADQEMVNVTGDALEGLTKAQFKTLKALLP